MPRTKKKDGPKLKALRKKIDSPDKLIFNVAVGVLGGGALGIVKKDLDKDYKAFNRKVKQFRREGKELSFSSVARALPGNKWVQFLRGYVIPVIIRMNEYKDKN